MVLDGVVDSGPPQRAADNTTNPLSPLALTQIEDLKAQLENCHQQLLDSSNHQQELELQLRTALEREHDVRTGYISPVSCMYELGGPPLPL